MSVETKKQLVINEDGDVFTSQEEMESWEAWAGEMAAIGEASPDARDANKCPCQSSGLNRQFQIFVRLSHTWVRKISGQQTSTGIKS